MNSKYKGIIILAIIIILAFLLINPGTDYERIDIVGSTSVQPLAEKLAENYMKSHEGVRIYVQGGGSGMGIMKYRPRSCRYWYEFKRTFP